MEDFFQFLYKLSTLNVAKNPKIGDAPHKPILLLTVFQMIRQGKIRQARLKLEPSLISEFKLNWHLLVTSHHSANIALPMFHMRSEGFWKLQTNAGYEKAAKVTRSVKNIKTFQEIFDCVLIDSQVFEILLDPKLNATAQDYLLWCYFPNTAHLYSKAESPAGYLDSKEQVRMVAEN